MTKLTPVYPPFGLSNKTLLVPLKQSFSKYGLCTPASPQDPLWGVHEVKAVFIIHQGVICLFCWFDICTEGAKATVGRTAGPLALIKAVAPNCTSHCFLYCHMLAVNNASFT